MSNRKLFLLLLLSVFVVYSTCRKVEKIMMVSTGTVSDISSNSAKVSGQIIDEGEGATQYGHYLSTKANETTEGSRIQSGNQSATGEFTTQLTSLLSDTKYYIKSYISDGEKIVYGKEISFNTLQLTNNPEYVSSLVANATPTMLEITYNLTLADIVPATSSFNVMVNSAASAVNSVSISGAKVMLTLASAVVYGDVVTVAYTKPATNPLQTASGGQAASITAQSVTNNVAAVLPVYVSSLVANATPAVLEMTYSLTLANIVPATSAFTVMVNSATRVVNSVSISGTKVILTLASAVVYGDVVTLVYTKPATNPLQTTSGGQAASITAQSVTNNVAAVLPVYVSSLVANATPAVLEMTYNLTLANIVPANSAFTVMVNSVTRTVSTVVISGTKVQLTLASPVNSGDVVTVAYTKPVTNPLQTASGGQAASITSQSVTNNVTAAIPVYVSSVVENATPSLLEMTYSMTLSNITPSTSAFLVLVNGGGNPVISVAIAGTLVQLTLSNPVVYGDLITVAYTKPLSNPIQTPVGGEAISIPSQSVSNNVLTIPSLITTIVSNITLVTANSGGEIIDNGGGPISNKGVCWNTSPNPSIADNHTDEGTGTSSFVSFITALTNNTTFYVRAYATNSQGTGYGNELTFKTFTGTVKDIENNSYYTITIGTQIWMAQNLKTTRFNDGTPIPLVTDTWGSATTPAYCWYNNDQTGFKNTYGALYNWYTVETGKLCPNSWHVPRDDEGYTLINYLGGFDIAGGKIKETGFLHWMSPNTGASNETGFTALPGGYRDWTFIDLGILCNLWTSTATNVALYMQIGYNSSSLYILSYSKGIGRSVRCIKD
jgi:uncharacterized protein (TIGR02145 family)/uncharacterized repeat protein (TIGR02059 family)